MRTLAVLAVVALYALVWLEPAVRLGTMPAKRAEVFVANTVCQGRVPNVTQISRARDFSMPATLRLHSFADIPSLSEPFVPMFTRAWRLELLVVVLGAVALAGALIGRAWGGLLALASAAAYVAVFGVPTDAFSLLTAVGPKMWWHAIQNWTWPMWRDMLLLPVVLGMIAAHASWLIARGAVRHRPETAKT